jgi:hypothetical protein
MAQSRNVLILTPKKYLNMAYETLNMVEFLEFIGLRIRKATKPVLF